jgi:hypothetical protein
MNHPKLALCLMVVGKLALGCDARGIRVGTEELCRADEDLQLAQIDSDERVSNCARIGENQLKNADFESPTATCENGLFCRFPAAEVGWQTSSESQVIEVWHDGHRNVPAPEGSQFVELDADSQDTLWQDLELPPGQLMYWAFLHRGRIGVESVELQIGPPEAVTSQGIFPSPTGAWSPYSGLYRTGADETVTRFALVSRTGVAEGNLIDAVVFAPVD